MISTIKFKLAEVRAHKAYLVAETTLHPNEDQSLRFWAEFHDPHGLEASAESDDQTTMGVPSSNFAYAVGTVLTERVPLQLKDLHAEAPQFCSELLQGALGSLETIRHPLYAWLCQNETLRMVAPRTKHATD